MQWGPQPHSQTPAPILRGPSPTAGPQHQHHGTPAPKPDPDTTGVPTLRWPPAPHPARCRGDPSPRGSPRPATAHSPGHAQPTDIFTCLARPGVAARCPGRGGLAWAARRGLRRGGRRVAPQPEAGGRARRESAEQRRQRQQEQRRRGRSGRGPRRWSGSGGGGGCAGGGRVGAPLRVRGASRFPPSASACVLRACAPPWLSAAAAAALARTRPPLHSPLAMRGGGIPVCDGGSVREDTKGRAKAPPSALRRLSALPPGVCGRRSGGSALPRAPFG